MGVKSTNNSNKRLGIIADFISGKYTSSSVTRILEKIISDGGIVTESGGYRYHVYLEPGTFNFSGSSSGSSSLTADILVIAGGGGGSTSGTPRGGGGGAGGVRELTQSLGKSGSYTITVGSGGAAEAKGNDSSIVGTAITSFVSTGGGLGGSGSGGSGGGGNSPNGAAGTGNSPPTTPSQGNPGGVGGSPGGAGGGGAGGVGSNGIPTGGPGGVGRAMPTWAAPIIAPAIPAPYRPTWSPVVGPTGLYGGGGGGAPYGVGGPGGGGSGNQDPPGGFPGINYTGGGGGAGFADIVPGGTGGPGIVIIRIPIT